MYKEYFKENSRSWANKLDRVAAEITLERREHPRITEYLKYSYRNVKEVFPRH